MSTSPPTTRDGGVSDQHYGAKCPNQAGDISGSRGHEALIAISEIYALRISMNPPLDQTVARYVDARRRNSKLDDLKSTGIRDSFPTMLGVRLIRWRTGGETEKAVIVEEAQRHETRKNLGRARRWRAVFLARPATKDSTKEDAHSAGH